MTRCPFLPFLEYELVTDEEVNCFTIEVVTFTQDFGPYKKGNKVDSLSFNFISGSCIEYCLTDQENYGKEVKRFNLVCASPAKMQDILNEINNNYVQKQTIGNLAGLGIGSVNYSTVEFVPWLVALIKRIPKCL